MAVQILLHPTKNSPTDAPRISRCPDCGGMSICLCNLESDGVSAETRQMLEQDFFMGLRGGRS